MVQLFYKEVGESATIVDIKANKRVKHYLNEMGITVGTDIVVLGKSFGNIILKVRDTRIALGREITKQIIVQK